MTPRPRSIACRKSVQAVARRHVADHGRGADDVSAGGSASTSVAVLDFPIIVTITHGEG